MELKMKSKYPKEYSNLKKMDINVLNSLRASSLAGLRGSRGGGGLQPPNPATPPRESLHAGYVLRRQNELSSSRSFDSQERCELRLENENQTC